MICFRLLVSLLSSTRVSLRTTQRLFLCAHSRPHTCTHPHTHIARFLACCHSNEILCVSPFFFFLRFSLSPSMSLFPLFRSHPVSLSRSFSLSTVPTGADTNSKASATDTVCLLTWCARLDFLWSILCHHSMMMRMMMRSVNRSQHIFLFILFQSASTFGSSVLIRCRTTKRIFFGIHKSRKN